MSPPATRADATNAVRAEATNCVRADATNTVRADIVAAARAWIGTPYHVCADVRGVGCDCAMLLVRVFCDLGLVAPFDPRPYSPDWHLHRSEEVYLRLLLERAHDVAAPAPGDVVLFRYGRCFSHGGIVTAAAPLTIVHAFAAAGVVLEEEIARNVAIAQRLDSARYASWFAPGAEGGA
jgi:NlpC/P60 family putative phage cell wall peptidase